MRKLIDQSGETYLSRSDLVSYVYRVKSAIWESKEFNEEFRLFGDKAINGLLEKILKEKFDASETSK